MRLLYYYCGLYLTSKSVARSCPYQRARSKLEEYFGLEKPYGSTTINLLADVYPLVRKFNMYLLRWISVGRFPEKWLQIWFWHFSSTLHWSQSLSICSFHVLKALAERVNISWDAPLVYQSRQTYVALSRYVEMLRFSWESIGFIVHSYESQNIPEAHQEHMVHIQGRRA